jgi:hypothetical protein
MKKIYITAILSIAFIGCAQTSGGSVVVNNIPPKKTFVKDEPNTHQYNEHYDNSYYGYGCGYYHCYEGYIGNGPLTYQGSQEDRENR